MEAEKQRPLVTGPLHSTQDTGLVFPASLGCTSPEGDCHPTALAKPWAAVPEGTFRTNFLPKRRDEEAVCHGLAQPCHRGSPGSPAHSQHRQRRFWASHTSHLDGRAVVGSGDAGVPVPAHVHCGVGPVLARPLRGALGTTGIFF